MWNAISASVQNLGDSAATKAKQAKIKTDMLMIDRSIDARKRAFGVAMYDYLSPLSGSPDFYAANDKLTEIVRPNLINAQKEIQALAAKRVKQKEALAVAEAGRAAAFPTKAETYGQKLINLGKAGYLHGGEAKIKTELSVTDRLIKGHKEDFGVALYNAFAYAEDNEGFLPTDRQIRNVYDTCRQDLTSFEQQKKAKEDEIVQLGGKRPSSEAPSVEQTQPQPQTSTYGATAAPPQMTPQMETFPTTTQQSPQVAGSGMFSHPVAQPSPQVAGTGMFSHPVPSSSGYSDNAPPYGATPVAADPFSTNTTTTQGYYNAPMPMNSTPAVDPFSTFSSNNNNNNPASVQQQPSSQQRRSSDLLIDF